MAKIDYEYHITEAQVRRYQQVPLIDRLRWLEELCVFTKMVRQAPTHSQPELAPAKTKSKSQNRVNTTR